MKRVSENQSNKSKNVIINKHYTYIKKKNLKQLMTLMRNMCINQIIKRRFL